MLVTFGKMRSLAVLVCLVVCPAPLAEPAHGDKKQEKKPAGRFIRVQRNGTGEPVTLQTARPLRAAGMGATCRWT